MVQVLQKITAWTRFGVVQCQYVASESFSDTRIYWSFEIPNSASGPAVSFMTVNRKATQRRQRAALHEPIPIQRQ
jgi:hypothetical protein